MGRGVFKSCLPHGYRIYGHSRSSLYVERPCMIRAQCRLRCSFVHNFRHRRSAPSSVCAHIVLGHHYHLGIIECGSGESLLACDILTSIRLRRCHLRWQGTAKSYIMARLVRVRHSRQYSVARWACTPSTCCRPLCARRLLPLFFKRRFAPTA